MRLAATATLLGLAGLSGPAAAQQPFWDPDNGVSVCSELCRGGDLQRIVPTGDGGAFIAWRDVRQIATFGLDVYVQRLTPSGAIAPGWPLEGLPVCVQPRTQDISDATSDGSGGVLITWSDFRSGDLVVGFDIYVQRILADGTIAPGWPVNGALACGAPRAQSNPVIGGDGAGGAYVAWEDDRGFLGYPLVFVQHLTAGGVPAPGWPVDGLMVSPTFGGLPALLSRSAEGFVVVWSGFASEPVGTTMVEVFAQHFLADGSLAAGWPEGGLLLAVDRGHRGRPVADGAGGFYTAWAFPAEIGDQDYFVQRVGFDGMVAAGWPAEGVPICSAPDNRFGLELDADGMGGVFGHWYDTRDQNRSDIYVTHVLPSGELVPGWPANGLPVSDPALSNEFSPEAAPDGMGGLYVAWETDDFDLGQSPGRLLRLTAAGEVAEGWPEYGVRISTSPSQFHPTIAPDEFGGAIVAWDGGGPIPRTGVFAQRFAVDGVVQTRPTIVSAEAEDGVVTLVWHAKSAGELQTSVERRTEYGTWDLLGAAVPDGPDGLRYEDRLVTAGGRYAYRLAYLDGESTFYTDEAWVSVPSDLRFALQGFRPNPAVGLPIVSLTLAKSEPARLEVFDLRGRLVLRRDLIGLGAGRHAVPLDGGVQLAPGVYVLRLSQGDQVAHVRGVILD